MKCPYVMKRLGKVIYLAACFVLSSGLVTYAAQTGPVGRQVVVHYSDLDMSHQPGAQILLARLENAASQTCGGAPDIRDLNGQAAYRVCLKDTMDRAVASVPTSLLAGLHGLPAPNVIAAR
jgi:UrcA family protein